MAGRGNRGHRWAALALAIALAACSRPAAPPPEPTRPAQPPVDGKWNLLLVSLDTTRADVLTELGAHQVAAPNLEKLLSEGVLWTKTETTFPMTLPAHSSLLTGLYPGAHGVRHNAQYALPQNEATLATVLKSAGYETGAFVAAYPLAPEFGLARGFDVYDADFDRTAGLNAERSARKVNEKAIPWIVRSRTRPFFAWVHYFEPHDPYHPPEPFRSRFPGNPYLGEVATMDAALGELLDTLKARGLEERTLVAVVSDHGEGLGQHEEPYHGILLYETSVHVFAVFHGGPLDRRSRRISFPTSITDVMPTALALLRIKPPETLQGLDLSAAIRGELAEPSRPGVFSETYYGWFEFGWNPLRAFRTSEWRYIEAPEPELYHLAEDPGEVKNLAGTMKERSAAMAKALREEEIRLARAGASREASFPMTPEQMERLGSLGYISGGAATTYEPGQAPAGPDPKAMMPLFARFLQAGSAVGQGQPDKAMAILDDIIARDPRNPIFRDRKALALVSLGRIDDAIKEYRSTMQDIPHSPHAYWELSLLYEKMGEPAKAVEVLRAMERVTPGWVRLPPRIVELLLQAGDRKGAADELQAAAGNASPREAAALLVQAAKFREETGDRDGAIALLGEALRLDPGQTDATRLLADIQKAP